MKQYTNRNEFYNSLKLRIFQLKGRFQLNLKIFVSKNEYNLSKQLRSVSAIGKFLSTPKERCSENDSVCCSKVIKQRHGGWIRGRQVRVVIVWGLVLESGGQIYEKQVDDRIDNG